MKKTLFACLLTALSTAFSYAQSDVNSRDLRGDVVYQDDNVVFRRIDDHTWIGNGHLCYNESLYIIEGEERALLIDAGQRIPGLAGIVAGITSKPVTLMATHVHPDHTGSAINEFDEMYINAADMAQNPRYSGRMKYLSDGQVIDLGGREIEVIFTPGHTPGSTTFFDKEHHYAFSGDAFGSTNLLVFTNLSTQYYTCCRIEKYMKDNDIKFMFPGHYSGDNLESPKRVSDLKNMCREILDGKRSYKTGTGNSGGLDVQVQDFGVRLNFSSRTGVK